MAIDPRTSDQIASSIQSNIEGKIAKLTNFLNNSFNSVWINAFSDELSEAEKQALVAQLSGWVDYAGETNLDQTDLDELDVTDVDPDEINELMEREQLDRIAPLVGVERDPGRRATGQVTIQTASSSTDIPEGMAVATQPDENGEYTSYFVDADGDGEIGDSGSVSPSGNSTSVTVNVIAEDVGQEYDTGANTVTFFPSPPAGVESVNNQNEISGGQDEQDNESLREDIKNAVFENSGGGTARGIIGYVSENADNVVDVSIDEFYNQQPPYVDVIVDGGSQQDVTDRIEESRPTGIEHNLVRPEELSVEVRADIVGSDFSPSDLSNEIQTYLTGLSLDDEFRRSKLMQRILNSDRDIVDIGSLAAMLTGVSTESHEYDGSNIYRLDHAELGLVENEEFLYDDQTDVYPLFYSSVDSNTLTVEAVVDGEQITLSGGGTDYSFSNDQIDFSAGGQNPDNRTVVKVSYEHSSWTIDSTIEDENGNTYDQNTDWSLIDNDADGLNDSIDWSGGSSPSNGDRWFVTYEPKQSIFRDLIVGKRTKVGSGSTITVNEYSEL